MNLLKKKKYFFYLSLLNLFWFGMNCPDLSQGGFLLCSLIMLIMFIQGPEDKIPPVVLFFLIAYLFLHYTALLSYGYIKIFQYVKEPILILACYKYGHFLGRSRIKSWPGGIIYILLALVAGFVIIAFLMVYMTPNMDMFADSEGKAGRTGTFIWTGQSGGFGPILGVQANMGAVFLPILIFGALKEFFKNKEFFIIAAISFCFITCGFYTNLLLKNRGPFIILVGLMIVIGGYNILFGTAILTPQKLKKRIIILLSITTIVILMIQLMPAVDLHHLGIISRFTEEGQRNPRADFWINCSKVIAKYPLGGRKEFFGHEFAHNIWLDVGFDSGIPAMICLMVFHIIHFKDMATLVFGRLPIHPGVVSAMIGMFFIIFISLFTEPIGKGYTIYYSVTFFYCGLLKRLKTDGVKYKNELILNEINHRTRYARRLMNFELSLPTRKS